jgi:hypothetical protein
VVVTAITGSTVVPDKRREPMGSRSKRQMTAAKKNREQAIKERRALKQEKKRAAAAARTEAAAEGTFPAQTVDDEFAPQTVHAESGESP